MNFTLNDASSYSGCEKVDFWKNPPPPVDESQAQIARCLQLAALESFRDLCNKGPLHAQLGDLTA